MGVHLFALMLHSCYLSLETWVLGFNIGAFRVTAISSGDNVRTLVFSCAFNHVQYMLAHLLEISVVRFCKRLTLHNVV